MFAVQKPWQAITKLKQLPMAIQTHQCESLCECVYASPGVFQHMVHANISTSRSSTTKDLSNVGVQTPRCFRIWALKLLTPHILYHTKALSNVGVCMSRNVWYGPWKYYTKSSTTKALSNVCVGPETCQNMSLVIIIVNTTHPPIN